jgi:cold shock CspA family protein
VSTENGIVKWYNPEKGYGFIAVDGGSDAFVHRRAIVDDRPWLVDGQRVSFTVREGMKGLEAIDVRVTEDVENIPPSRTRAYNNSSDAPRREERPRRERETYSGPVPTGPIDATVLRLDPSGRFMFVRADTEGFDVYVHSSIFQRMRIDPREGDRVRVTVEQSDRGLRASSIELL